MLLTSLCTPLEIQGYWESNSFLLGQVMPAGVGGGWGGGDLIFSPVRAGQWRAGCNYTRGHVATTPFDSFLRICFGIVLFWDMTDMEQKYMQTYAAWWASPLHTQGMTT